MIDINKEPKEIIKNTPNMIVHYAISVQDNEMRLFMLTCPKGESYYMVLDKYDDINEIVYIIQKGKSKAKFIFYENYY